MILQRGAVLVIWLMLAQLQAELPEINRMSVRTALNSQLPCEIFNVVSGAERALKLTSTEGQAILDLVSKSCRDYSEKVQIKQNSSASFILAALPLKDQSALESEFDLGLIRLFGKTKAENIKFLFVRFFYVQTGAFGKYQITLSPFQNADSENCIKVDSAPFKHSEYLGLEELAIAIPGVTLGK